MTLRITTTTEGKTAPIHPVLSGPPPEGGRVRALAVTQLSRSRGGEHRGVRGPFSRDLAAAIGTLQPLGQADLLDRGRDVRARQSSRHDASPAGRAPDWSHSHPSTKKTPGTAAGGPSHSGASSYFFGFPQGARLGLQA